MKYLNSNSITSPAISIIVPVYNAEKFLKRCIESILTQTFTDFELIMINDCSKDNSWEILEEYAKKDLRIKLINLPENIRQGGARNRGLDIAQGEYICFIDSDDWVHHSLLETIYTKCLETKADFCGYNYVHISDVNRIKSGNKYSPKEAIGDDVKQDLEQDAWLSKIGNLNRKLALEEKERLIIHTAGICNNFFSRDIIEKQHLRFPEKMAYEDNYFVKLYCFYVETYAYIAEPFYYYFINEDSTTQVQDPEFIYDRLKIEEMKIRKYKELSLFEKYKSAIEIDFLILYYLNSIGLFYTKMTKPPVDKVKEMTKRLHQLFPNVAHNKYFKTDLRFREKAKYWIARICPGFLKILYKLLNR